MAIVSCSTKVENNYKQLLRPTQKQLASFPAQISETNNLEGVLKQFSKSMLCSTKTLVRQWNYVISIKFRKHHRLMLLEGMAGDPMS